MFDISPVQIVIVLVIALLIFGPRRLPDLGRSLGRGIRDFKGGITGEDDGPATPAHAQATQIAEAQTVAEELEDAPTGTSAES